MATLLYGLAEATLWSGLLIVFVFLIRKPVVRYFGANWGYALWLLPALKMMIIVTPQTQLSLLPSWQTILYNFNMQQGVFALLQNKKPLTASEALFKQIEAENTVRMEAMKTAIQESDSPFPAERLSESSLSTIDSPSSDPVGGWPVFSEIDGMTILFFAWLAGFMVMGLITVGGHARLQKQLQREKRKPSPEMIWLLEQLARKMGVKFRGEVLVSARIQAPAVTGWLHPKLVLPFRFAEFYSKQEMEFMLSHELVHLQRKDYLFITWALLLKCIYWFNPLVYLAYPLFRLDQELACDQLVLTSVAPQERKSYGLTILKTLSQPEMMFENFQAGCFWFTFSQMKERIAMINHHRNSKGRSMLALISMIVLGFTALTFAASDMVKDPTTGKMVSAPEYGGTLTYAKKHEPPHTDSWFGSPAGAAHSGVVEKLADGNWGIDRNEHHFKSNFTPLFAIRGQLAESWEQPDPLTIVFKIRQGVHWHKKAPMNGRAHTAEDVVFNFHRLTGMGSGFTEPSTVAIAINAVPFESISATDKDTVVFKLKQPQPGALMTILDDPFVFIQPPEVIRQHGDVKDWRNLVGTGPFMLTDWVEGSSMTWVKNPHYWGSDEKYPNNRLPYVDELRALILPEDPTILAALRSGKLDYIGHLGVSQIFTIDEAESLKKTNPEIALHPFAFRSETSFATAVRKPPFDDLRVRIALQKALDLETINETYFRGWAEWKPMGLNGIGLKGYVIPFDEWPEALQQEYTYDPDGAEKLLDEAGYPRGADGIRFKTVLIHFNRWDLAFRELVANYWGKIGVAVEIQEVDGTTYGVYHTRKQLHEGIIDAVPGYEWNPLGQLIWNSSAGPALNFTDAQDPVYDAMVEAANAATTLEEQQKVIIEADMYIIKNHWYIWGGRAPQFNANQPWLIGYNGEMQMGNMALNGVFARLWIDQELKKEMGF